MAIMAPITEEDSPGAQERIFLSHLVEFVRAEDTPTENYYHIFQHFKTVLERAQRNEEYYEQETRELFMRILGAEEGLRFVETMLPFIEAYLKRCEDAGDMLALDFQPSKRREEVAVQIEKLGKELRPCFPIWPPPRRGSCF